MFPLIYLSARVPFHHCRSICCELFVCVWLCPACCACLSATRARVYYMASYVSSPSIQAAKSAPLSRIVSPICKYEVAALLAPAPHRGSIYAVWPKPSRSGAVVGGAKFVKVWVQVGRHALAGLPAQYSCTGQKSVLDAVTPLLQFVLLKCYRIGTSGTHKSWKIARSVLDA